jgi:hypothetical protein
LACFWSRQQCVNPSAAIDGINFNLRHRVGSLTAAELGIVLKTLYNKLNQWQEERAKTAG